MTTPQISWNGWTLNKGTYELVYTPDVDRLYTYAIDLERCTSSAEMLDWIMQVTNKTWATDECVAGMVRALNDVLAPQATLCSMGIDKTMQPSDIRAVIDRS